MTLKSGLEVVPFIKSLGYSPSIVTMVLSCIDYEILVENRETHLYLAPPQGVNPVGILWKCLMLIKLGLPYGEKNYDDNKKC